MVTVLALALTMTPVATAPELKTAVIVITCPSSAMKRLFKVKKDDTNETILNKLKMISITRPALTVRQIKITKNMEIYKDNDDDDANHKTAKKRRKDNQVRTHKKGTKEYAEPERKRVNRERI